MKIGNFSRGGHGRSAEAVRALDHDMSPEAVLVPAGILEVDTSQLSIVFGASRGTSDFVADCLDLWWSERSGEHAGIRRLQIDLDNGPEIASYAIIAKATCSLRALVGLDSPASSAAQLTDIKATLRRRLHDPPQLQGQCFNRLCAAGSNIMPFRSTARVWTVFGRKSACGTGRCDVAARRAAFGPGVACSVWLPPPE